MDWLDLLAVQGTLKSPTPQFKSINSSALSFHYSPTLTSIHDYWKNIALTRWTFVGKVMSLLFNILSRLSIGEGNGSPLQYSCLENPRDRGAWWAAVCGIAQSQTRLKQLSSGGSSRLSIAFLPRSKRLLISWLQSPFAVILEPKKIVSHCFHCFPIYLP